MSAIVQLAASDLDKVTALLEDNQLQTSDLSPQSLSHFVGARTGTAIVAVGGIEIFGANALLRSVAVSETSRGEGLGVHIVRALETQAGKAGIETLYLLTETAEAFFEPLGYERTDRDKAPATIQATAQFSQLCPSSATCMIKRLVNARHPATHRQSPQT